MSVVKNYLSLIKFSHTIFAMPFALIGFSLGIYKLATINLDLSQDIGIEDLLNRNPWVLLLLVVLCMVFARSAAMAFNRYLDRQFDAKNPRTAIREIPAGILKADSVLLFTIFCGVAFVATTWFINPLCFYLSPVALVVVLGYSYTKRFTALCHLVLGVGLSLAPIGAYLAVTGVFDWLPLLFSFTVICWVSGFDIIYALQDEEFDKNNQLHSIPAALGKVRALIVSRSLHMLSAGFVIGAGLLGDFTFIYWIGVAVFVGMLVYQHSIVKPTDLRRVNIAFMTANGIASVVFAVFVIADIFFG
ncbi:MULTISPECIES: UbiA-like polyprenyltransferase [unclassified Paraflavitalea]|uniref:UbiA-like polyprenyltransferase n=1 Tax=unclassified Paraflavitalea TaxID=2798305 RepID=UPI003D3258F8